MRIARPLAAAAAAAAAALAAGALAGCSPHEPTTDHEESPDFTVFGAASTRVINDGFQDLSHNTLTFVNAGSTDLVQQLKDGAEADVLITADRRSMDAAVDAGVARDPQEVATNSMVLVVPRGNPAGIRSVEDVQREGVNLVLCDAQVPCGSVSQELIRANNLSVQPVSLEHNVTNTLGKVTSGEADAAFVYRTDAAAAGDAVETIDIPHSEDHRNAIMAAVVTSTARDSDASQLVAVLRNAEMAKVWSEHGFTPAEG